MLYDRKREEMRLSASAKCLTKHIQQMTAYGFGSGLTRWAMSGWQYRRGTRYIADTGNSDRVRQLLFVTECFRMISHWMFSEMTGNDHDFERPPTRWNWPRLSGAGNPILDQLPEYAYRLRRTA